MNNKGKGGVLISGAFILLALTGCSRQMMNYQIAESIGTVGRYPGNEPVETPKMKEERLQNEAESEARAQAAEQLKEASALAVSCRYDEAIKYLQGIDTEDEEIKNEVLAAISEYQDAQKKLTVYEGDISHLCFSQVIEDTSLAFDGDDRSSGYENNMITARELDSILQSLYDNGYMLVDIHDIAAEETDERGVTAMQKKELALPPGKKPVVISQDNLSYAGVNRADGIATRLVQDADGSVKAEYVDAAGRDKTGDYDFIPIVNSFVDEHPDFSYKGAKGIVSVSGAGGIFGYDVSEDTAVQETVRSIARALKDEGWNIATCGYSYSYMNDMSVSQLTSDIGKWLEEDGTVLGDTDILFYPYGGEVQYPSQQLDYLTGSGFKYLCGLWGDQDFLEIGEGYMRQTRRMINGSQLMNNPDYFSAFFDASALLDSDR